MTESEYVRNNGIAKIQGFGSYVQTQSLICLRDEATMSFIKSNVAQLWNSTTYPVEYIFRKFYCKIVDGKVEADVVLVVVY
ncbi:MAG: hypothetical protein MRQ09_01835 [Candidatus Midichloria sp.]|nr:hypothetical protein [Candidatus Midichloria sp.]